MSLSDAITLLLAYQFGPIVCFMLAIGLVALVCGALVAPDSYRRWRRKRRGY